MRFLFYLKDNIKILQQKEKHQDPLRKKEKFAIRCYKKEEWDVLCSIFQSLGYSPKDFYRGRFEKETFSLDNPLCVGINGISAFLNEGGREIFTRRYSFGYLVERNINIKTQEN